MAGDVDSDKPVDPATERELQDTMDQALREMQNENTASLARYLRGNYKAFRKVGFSRKESFTFTALLFQTLLAHG